MVERQLRGRGIEDERVLAAMGDGAPRGLRAARACAASAYADSALPIGEGQTISQPWIVAAICQALELGGGERVLEVGTGSGYSAAVLAQLAAEVISVERHPELARSARRAPSPRLGVANVEVVVGDGSLGLPDEAPFDAIAVHAAAPGAAPRPARPARRRRPPGRAARRRGRRRAHPLRRRGEEARAEPIGPCRFVPLIGEEGFARRDSAGSAAGSARGS